MKQKHDALVRCIKADGVRAVNRVVEISDAGRALRNAVGRWYVSREADDLALQAVKYLQRDGWSHGDLLRLAHSKAPSPQHDAVFRWMLASNRAASRCSSHWTSAVRWAASRWQARASLRLKDAKRQKRGWR